MQTNTKKKTVLIVGDFLEAKALADSLLKKGCYISIY